MRTCVLACTTLVPARAFHMCVSKKAHLTLSRTLHLATHQCFLKALCSLSSMVANRGRSTTICFTSSTSAFVSAFRRFLISFSKLSMKADTRLWYLLKQRATRDTRLWYLLKQRATSQTFLTLSSLPVLAAACRRRRQKALTPDGINTFKALQLRLHLADASIKEPRLCDHSFFLLHGKVVQPSAGHVVLGHLRLQLKCG